MGDKIVAAVRQCQIAAVLFDLQRYDEAEKTLREALPVLTDSKKTIRSPFATLNLPTLWR